MDGIYGEELLRWAAERSADPLWTNIWRAIASLGAPALFAVALPLLFVLGPVRPALRLALAFGLGVVVTEWIKVAVDRARPDPAHFGLAAPLEDFGIYASSAFPSGHALLAVVLWGTLAVHARSGPVRATCILLIALICASRIALLRHDLLDVAGGIVIGTILLVALVRAERAWSASLAELPRIERAGLWVLGAIAAQVIVQLEVTAVVLGVVAGFAASVTLAAERRVRPGPPGPIAGVVRALLAVAGVALVRLWAEPGQGWSTAALFAVYAAAGVWLGAVIPLAFGGVWEKGGATRTA